MDKYILFEPNAFFYQSGKACLQEFWGGRSTFVFVTKQQCDWAAFLAASVSVQSWQKLLNMDKYILFEPNTFLYQAGKACLQEFWNGWSTFIIVTKQQFGWTAILAASVSVQS